MKRQNMTSDILDLIDLKSLEDSINAETREERGIDLVDGMTDSMQLSKYCKMVFDDKKMSVFDYLDGAPFILNGLWLDIIEREWQGSDVYESVSLEEMFEPEESSKILNLTLRGRNQSSIVYRTNECYVSCLVGEYSNLTHSKTWAYSVEGVPVEFIEVLLKGDYCIHKNSTVRYDATEQTYSVEYERGE